MYFSRPIGGEGVTIGLGGTYSIALPKIKSKHYETASSVDWSLPSTLMGDTTWAPTVVALEDENDWKDSYWKWDLIKWLGTNTGFATGYSDWYGEQRIWNWDYTFGD